MANPFSWREAAAGLPDAWQREQETQQRSLQFLEQLLTPGQTPDGFIGDLQGRIGAINTLGDVAQQRGWAAVTPVMEQWIGPAMSGAWGREARDAAIGLLSQYGSSQGIIDPRLQQYLYSTPSMLQDYGVRADALATLVPTFAKEDWFKQLYTNYMEQALPGGSAQGVPIAQWASAMSPYLAMTQAYNEAPGGNPGSYAAAGLPAYTPPEPHSGMTRQGQDVARSIQEMMASLSGLQFGPQGFVTETPGQASREMVSGAPAQIPNLNPNLFPANLGSPGAVPTAGAGAPQGPSVWQNILSSLSNSWGNVFPPQPGSNLTPEQRGNAVKQAGDAIIAQAQANGVNLNQVVSYIGNNQWQWLPVFGGDIRQVSGLMQYIADVAQGRR